jgi:hypothetical protein
LCVAQILFAEAGFKPASAAKMEMIMMEKRRTPHFEDSVRDLFKSDVDSLERMIIIYTKCYLDDPKSVDPSQLRKLIIDTYALTVKIFDAITASGDSLLSYEQEIYDLCKQQLSAARTGRIKGPISALFFSIQLIHDCIDAVRDMFGLLGDKEKADNELKIAGDLLLPDYASILSQVFVTIDAFFTSDFGPILFELGVAQYECAMRYQNPLAVDKPLSSNMVNIALYAYGNRPFPNEQFIKLARNEVPASIRTLYDENKGLLESAGGLRVWLGKQGDNIAVGFSGTDVTSLPMLYADIAQLSRPSVLYLKAAGLLKIMLEANPLKNFCVTGHSLGGGLTQFAVTANIRENQDRLTGWAFNPAGLSGVSLRNLTQERIESAKRHIYVFITYRDPVSLVGGKLGCVVTLPRTHDSGHGIMCVRQGFDAYMADRFPYVQTVRLTLNNNSNDDFIPGTKTLSCIDSAGRFYPLFDNNPGDTSAFGAFDFPQALFDAFGISQKAEESVLGVYNKFNGTAHTVVNRLLLMQSGKPYVIPASYDNAKATIVYGKFGLGIETYTELFVQRFADSKLLSVTSRSDYELVLGCLRNPYEYDSADWFAVIEHWLGIKVSDLFLKKPDAERVFREFLINLMSDRADLYNSIAKNCNIPTHKDKIDFIIGYKDLAMNAFDKLLSDAVRFKIITVEQKTDCFCAANNFAIDVLMGV